MKDGVVHIDPAQVVRLRTRKRVYECEEGQRFVRKHGVWQLRQDQPPLLVKEWRRNQVVRVELRV